MLHSLIVAFTPFDPGRQRRRETHTDAVVRRALEAQCRSDAAAKRAADMVESYAAADERHCP